MFLWDLHCQRVQCTVVLLCHRSLTLDATLCFVAACRKATEQTTMENRVQTSPTPRQTAFSFIRVQNPTPIWHSNHAPMHNYAHTAVAVREMVSVCCAFPEDAAKRVRARKITTRQHTHILTQNYNRVVFVCLLITPSVCTLFMVDRKGFPAETTYTRQASPYAIFSRRSTSKQEGHRSSYNTKH